MTELAYYPGCALQSMSWEYRESIKHVTTELDIHLDELKDWTCCGATAAHSLDERMSIILPARNLASSQIRGKSLAVACPMCLKRLTYSKQMLAQKRVEDPWSVDPDIAITDLARLLATETLLDRIRDRVKVPLKGMRIVSYYGCQVVRSPKLMGYTDYENPQHLDRLVEAAGAIAVDWSLKATCCGASMGIPRKAIGLALVQKLLMWAQASRADAIVVCCPLCQNNLDLYQLELCDRNGWDPAKSLIPIFYYTELLGLSFGLDSIYPGLKSHMVNPLPLVGRVIGR